jgi:hypothetical protein
MHFSNLEEGDWLGGRIVFLVGVMTLRAEFFFEWIRIWMWILILNSFGKGKVTPASPPCCVTSKFVDVIVRHATALHKSDFTTHFPI